jgi:hypothetical protein
MINNDKRRCHPSLSGGWRFGIAGENSRAGAWGGKLPLHRRAKSVNAGHRYGNTPQKNLKFWKLLCKNILKNSVGSTKI